ncbi:DUF4190 domain-containing protein [Nocardia sp. CDC159]|uniref:DUF4190 domain-containing protein n=1 Tax=Nocardia pulmonis TaxID=2951408 RepID=A0A9X2EFK5_9NOCA|nr:MULTISPECIES: DUF4190 domain-containing protein [Nocardia]MCM6777316.1 DUF4190 domain-containing protein [Nocardia pulmonis]MCM6790201.1 DUF4190 domain-containing protein [Nocardia sp. CDC159]
MSYPPSPPPYGHGYMPYRQQEHPQATTILVLGILGFFCGLVAPFAWVMGRKALREIDASGGMLGGRTNVQIGYILGIVSTVLMIASIVFLVLYAIVMVAVVGTSYSA